MKHFLLCALFLSMSFTPIKAQIKLRSYPLANASVGLNAFGLLNGNSYHLQHADVFGYETWNIQADGLGFQFQPGILMYEGFNPIYESFVEEHVGRNSKTYWKRPESLRISPSIKGGPTCLLSQMGPIQLHGFLHYAIYLRRWRVAKHIARDWERHYSYGALEGSYQNSRIYETYARMTSIFNHFRLGMTSLFTVKEQLCSISIWAEIHPPHNYIFEINEITSGSGLSVVKSHQSTAELLFGAGIQFHDVSGWKVLKDIL